MVLLKGLDARGLSFFTNLESPKSRHIRRDPRVALTFWWERLERQVRVEGRCSPVGDDEADAYFAGRPRGSRLGALASRQSEPIENRAALEARLAELEARHPEGSDIPRPRDWGGWRVAPFRFEFWQGRRDRLHDRLSVEAQGDGWTVQRLSP
jgi:pyridoxamine 5'-phosphate oxidase